MTDVEPAGETGSLTGRELVRRVSVRWRVFLGTWVAVFLAVAIWTFVATPRYRSEARLRIQNETPIGAAASALSDQLTSVPGANAAGGLLSLGKDELETEIAVLKSNRIADEMIDSLAFGVRALKPAASRAAVVHARTVDPNVDIDGTLTLTRRGDGHYRTDWSGHDSNPTIPAMLIPGVPVQIGGFAVMLPLDLLGSGPSKIVVKFLPRYKVYKLLDKRLTIERQEGGSRLVEVTYDDPDRVLAAQVLNVLVNDYMQYTKSTERTEDTISVVELRGQVDSTFRSLTASESALRQFQEQSRLIDPKEQAADEVKRLSVVSTKVDAIAAERNALYQMLQIIGRRSDDGKDPAAYRQLATFPSLISNRAIQDLLQTLVQLENERSALGVRRTEENPEYKQLSDRIVQVEGELYQVGPQYLESLDQQLASTVHTASALGDTLDMLPAAATRYGQLLRERTVQEATYVALLKELKAAELKDLLRQDRIRLVDVPRVANRDDPQFPKKPVMLVLGAVLGLALAVVAVFGMELW
jgi:uncharacterized protein involved in exopolysaccharide biosynthesis